MWARSAAGAPVRLLKERGVLGFKDESWDPFVLCWDASDAETSSMTHVWIIF